MNKVQQQKELQHLLVTKYEQTQIINLSPDLPQAQLQNNSAVN